MLISPPKLATSCDDLKNVMMDFKSETVSSGFLFDWKDPSVHAILHI